MKISNLIPAKKTYLVPILCITVGLLAGWLLTANNSQHKTGGKVSEGNVSQEDREAVAGSEPSGGSTKHSNTDETGTAHVESQSVASSQAITIDTLPENYPYDGERREGDEIVAKDGRRYPNRRYNTLLTPNDPYATQWWTDAISLPAMWDIGAGSNDTILAVIDTGFSLNHQEFSGRMYQNALEVGATSEKAPSILNCTDRELLMDRSCNLIDDDGDGIVDNESGPTDRENPSRLNCNDRGLALDKSCNMIDDSGNELIDDVTGWDFVSFHPSVEGGKQNPDGPGTKHGTIVAGVAAASGNNGIGIAGVDWYTTILPIQSINDDGYGDSLSVGRSIRYAAQQGADVINLSLGTPSNDPYIRTAIRYAIETGSIVVAASGNDGCECTFYPAAFPEVLAVGAINQSEEKASFSNWGSHLDILAPGTSMTTPVWNGLSTSSYVSGVAGTSVAAPVVSGLLTLARSHQPDASWTELIGVMNQTTDRALLGSQPRTTQAGYGTTDAISFMRRITTPAIVAQSTRFLLSGTATTLHSSRMYQCDIGQPGGTPLYRLVQNNSVRYSVNELYRETLRSSGWSSQLFAHLCAGLPRDNVTDVRLINPAREFDNSSLKTILD
ncbi:hypothetical protein BH23PAT2_BH23PAT2_08430 [soil metagenome]